MRLLKILRHIFVVALQRELAHRANFVFEGLLLLTGAAAGVIALSIVFVHTPTLAGWRAGEAIVLLGSYQMVSGLLQAFVEPNLAWFGSKVLRGELDDVLLQPAPSLLLVSLGACHPWALSEAVLGGAIATAGLAHLGASLSPAGLIAGLLLVLIGTVIAWASRVVLASLAFWAPGVQLDVLYGAFWQLGRYPVGIYHPVMNWMLTYVVPVAFIATIPARAFTRGADPAMLVQGIAAALGAVLLVHLVWRAGLRRYTGATS